MAIRNFFTGKSSDQQDNGFNDEYYNTTSAEKENTDLGYDSVQPEQKPEAPRPSGRKSADFGATCSMKIMKPASNDDGYAIIDALIANNAVILNLENLAPDAQSQLTCFLAGAAYALRGNFRAVSTSTYMVTPKSVSIHEDAPQAEAEEEPAAQEEPEQQFTSSYGYQGYGSGYRG